METWMLSCQLPISPQWQQRLEAFPPNRGDIYYSPAYCSSWLEWDVGTAVCLHERYEGIDYLYCFVLKELPRFYDEHWRYDAQSFYGYGGIISSAPPEERHLELFNDMIDQWMQEQGVVAEFVRQNPLLHRIPHYARRAGMIYVRTNVYTFDPQQVQTHYSGALLRNIRKAEREGLRIERWDSQIGAAPFARLYSETARRLGMAKFYHFPLLYFQRCADLMGQYVHYAVALYKDEPVAALMLLQWKDKLTYHLGASDERFWYMRPNDLLFNWLLRYAADQNIACVSLGGGTTSSPDDSLYRYKCKFGDCHLPVYIGKRVHNRQLYHQLCSWWDEQHPELAEKYQNYFLRYRIEELLQPISAE